MNTIPKRHYVLGAAVATVTLLLLNLQLVQVQRSADRRVGIVIEDVDRGVQISEVEDGTPARRGGLRPGDLIIAIDGENLASSDDYDGLADHFRRGQPVTYDVLRDGAEISVSVAPGMSADWLGPIGEAVVVFGYLGLALLTLAQPQRDRRGVLLFLFASAVAVELALPTPTVGGVQVARLSTLTFFLLTGFEIGVELHLVSLIPRRPSWLQRRPWLVPAFYCFGLLVGASTFAAYLCESLNLPGCPISYEESLNLLNLLWMPLWAVAITAILVHQVVRSTQALARQQAALVLLGELPWALLVVTGTLAEIFLGEVPEGFTMLESPVLLCFPIAIFVAVFRYQLIDIELVVRRSMVYTTLTGALVLVFYGAVGAGSAMLSQWIGGRTSVLVISAATLILGLLFSPLRRALQAIISRRLFPERVEQRQRLVALAAELPSFGKVPLMGRHLVFQMQEIFATETATLLVAEPVGQVLVTVASTIRNPERDFDQSFLLAPDDPAVQSVRRSRRPQPAEAVVGQSASLAQRLRVFNASLVVPIMSQDYLVGLLLLGDKRGKVAYLSEELELLTLLSHHVASVFENARLFESATTDSLTGLLRRETILIHLEREVQRAERHRRPLAVGMADLDHFKEINDRHGHLAGDSLLKRVAQALNSGLRSADLVGRYGGEEFLFVLPESDLEGARVVAEKIRRNVARIRLRMEDGSDLRTTISIGLSTLEFARSEGLISAQSLLASADSNLLLAKGAGRNRIEPAEVVANSSPEGTSMRQDYPNV